MVHDHLNKLSITFQQYEQCEIWWQLPKWFLKNHDFIHVNSTVAGKYNKHKQDGSHLGFPITMIFALSVQEKKFKTDFQNGRYSRNLGFPIATI